MLFHMLTIAMLGVDMTKQPTTGGLLQSSGYLRVSRAKIRATFKSFQIKI